MFVAKSKVWLLLDSELSGPDRPALVRSDTVGLADEACCIQLQWLLTICTTASMHKAEAACLPVISNVLRIPSSKLTPWTWLL